MSMSHTESITSRIQRHEYRNTLHTLIGLQEIARRTANVPSAPVCSSRSRSVVADVVARVRDPLVQGHLVGKLLTAAERRVDLRIRVASALPRRTSRPQELVTALGNLIDNAMDAVTEQAMPRVEVALALTGDESGDMRVTVADNGPGVPTEIRRSIFEAGFSTKTAYDGHQGLGLALVADIVRRRGGTTQVSDRPGGGAVFDVCLPEEAAAEGGRW